MEMKRRFHCDRCGKPCAYDIDYPYSLCYQCELKLSQEISEENNSYIKRLELKLKSAKRKKVYERDKNAWLVKRIKSACEGKNAVATQDINKVLEEFAELPNKPYLKYKRRLKGELDNDNDE